MFEELLNTHRRLRYSVRGPEWAFVIPYGDSAALADIFRRCSSFWNGAGCLILPVKPDGRLPPSLEVLLDARAVDLTWVHSSVSGSHAAELGRRLGQTARLHDRFDERETHPLRLLPASVPRQAPRLVIPSGSTAVARTLALALWGDISDPDLPYYRERCDVSVAQPGAETWKALIDGQIAGPVTSPLLMVQTGMEMIWAGSSAEYPYLWIFSQRPSFASLVAFWNFRARLIADAAGAPVLGVPHQALSSPEALSCLGEWLHRPPGHRVTPDCFVTCTRKQAPSVQRALAGVPMVRETADKYQTQFGKDITPNQPPTFAFADPQLWAQFQRGLVNTQLVTIVNGRTSLALPAPDGFAVRDHSHVRLTMHDLPLAMPVTRAIAESVYANAVPGDGGVRITTWATAEWNLDITLPSAARALSDWAKDRGFEVNPTREALDAEAILKRLGSLDGLDDLASEQRLALLEMLAPPSTRKLAQRLVAELRQLGERVDEQAVAEKLASMSLFLELRGRTAANLASSIGAGTRKKDVLALLPDLVAGGFVRRAREVICPECRYRALLDLAEQDEIVRCRACQATYPLPVLDADATKEPELVYRLDGLMARAMSQDIVPVLLALRAFAKSRPAVGSFAAWPGLLFKAHDGSFETEVDLVVSFGAVVFCCEVKKSARGLKAKQLEGLFRLCERLEARPAIAALHGEFSRRLSERVTELRGRVLDADTLLAQAPGVQPPPPQFGRFAGLVTQSGVWS